jgi:hypothetical protein
MLDLSNPAIAWLLDGSVFSLIVLGCLLCTALFWAWTRWTEWGLGFLMVATLITQMILRYS